jgi:hypothetical protein
MRRQMAIWRSDVGRQLWLSMLIDAMEEAARPEIRAVPCAPEILAGLHAQLSQPALPYAFGASAFSLRN